MERSAASRTAALETWLLRFYLFAAAGWLWEVLLTACVSGNWVNRGLLHGPWLPVYGIGGVLLAALLGGNRGHSLFLLFGGALVCGGIEYGTSLVLEHVYHRRWWDYTGSLGSIQGRVCLAGLAGFGIAGWLVSWMEPPLGRLFEKLSPGVRTVFCRAASLCFALDWSLSLLYPNTGVGITMPV